MELLDEAKQLCSEEYKKSLIKKAIDVKFDTSYIALVALTLTLAALVLVNRNTQDEVARIGIWVIIATIGCFVIYEFCKYFGRKEELLNLIQKETQCLK